MKVPRRQMSAWRALMESAHAPEQLADWPEIPEPKIRAPRRTTKPATWGR